MTVKVELTGFAELDAALGELRQPVAKAVMRRALVQAAEPTVEAAKAMAPRDDGDLDDSITASHRLSPRQAGLHRKAVRDDRASAEAFVGAGPVPQAHLQEFGTFKDAPQPFMRPAWEGTKMEVLRRLADTLRDEIAKSVARARRKAARRR